MSLVLGKNRVTVDDLRGMKPPTPTETFIPIPHIHLVNLTRETLTSMGFDILEEEHVTQRDDLRYFGGFALTHESLTGEKRRIVCGIRNANDRSFAAAICLGTQMLVCDNLCFSSERKLARRHTKNIVRDLPRVIAAAVSGLADEWNAMKARIARYTDYRITEEIATHLTTKLIDHQALPPRDYYNVITKWRNPEAAAKEIVSKEDYLTQAEVAEAPGTFVDVFDEAGYQTALEEKEAALIREFGGNTLWGLYNAVTHALKGSDVQKLPGRTMAAQALFDATVDFSASVGEIVNEVETEIVETGESADAFAEIAE